MTRVPTPVSSGRAVGPSSTTSVSTSCSQESAGGVDEPGPATSTASVGRRCGVERLGQGHGQLARVATGLLGGGQRHVARPVPVLPPGRALEVDLVGERVDLERVQGGAQGIGELVADQRGSSIGMGR
jgi:hypothetical protein